jgi:hypothetical protein
MVTRKIWFASCDGIARMGPFASQEKASAALWTTAGRMAKGAFVWPEHARQPRTRARPAHQRQLFR